MSILTFPHGKVTVRERLESPTKRGRRITCKEMQAMLRGPSKFIDRRGLRRGLRIGGRTRFPASPTGYTSRMANLVLDAGHILSLYRRGLFVMLTLTIPASSEEAIAVQSAASGYIVDRLRRWMEDRTVDGLYTYVWERQSRGAAHLHWLCRLPPEHQNRAFYKAIRLEWYQILCDVSKQTGIDLFLSDNGGSWRGKPESVQLHCRVVKTTCAAYLAKYAGKRESKAGSRRGFYPGRWGGCSSRLRQMVGVLRKRATAIIHGSVDAGEFIARAKEVMVKLQKPADRWFEFAAPDLVQATMFLRELPKLEMVMTMMSHLTMGVRLSGRVVYEWGGKTMVMQQQGEWAYG